MSKQRISRRTILKGLGATAATAAGGLGFPGILKAADTVKLGFLAPTSGPLAFVGQTNLNCLNLAIDEMNAAGGAGGRKIEVIVEDSQMSTKVTVDKARKLLIEDKVDAVLGMVIPPEREGALSIAQKENKLVFYPNFDEGRCDPNLVTTGLGPNQQVDPLMPWLTAHAGKSLYFLASDLGSNRNVFFPRLKSALEKAGGKVVGEQYFPFGTRDFGPALQKIKADKPDMVWADIGDDPITFMKQYASFGMKTQFLTRIMHESIAFATQGGSVGTLYVAPYFSSVDSAANNPFRKKYTERFKDFDNRRIRDHAPILPHGEMTYVAARVFGAAVAKAGSTAADKVRVVLGDVSIDAPRGKVRIEPRSQRVVCDSLLGRVAADNGIDLVANLGTIVPECSAA